MIELTEALPELPENLAVYVDGREIVGGRRWGIELGFLHVYGDDGLERACFNKWERVYYYDKSAVGSRL